VPPHLSSPAQLNTVSAIAREPHIPQQFMIQIEIQRQVVQYSTALAGEVDPGTASTLLNLFNNELDNLFKLFKETWSPRLEIQLLGAKLYLFSVCLIIASKRHGLVDGNPNAYVRDPTRFPVQLGLSSAVSLIHNISELKRNMSGESTQHALGVIHYPKYYFRLVVFAVGFLMKFLSANPKASQEDRELAISHITTAHQLFSSFSTGLDFANVAQTIEMWAKNLKEDKEDDSDPVIKTRSGASLLYHIVNKLKDPQRRTAGDDHHTSGTGPASETRSAEDHISAATSLDAADLNASMWAQAGPYTDLSAFQPGLEDSLDGTQWMSDDMLLEMFRL
jgi:hypothetical protein